MQALLEMHGMQTIIRHLECEVQGAHLGGVTVDKLLLAQGDEVARVDGVHSLHRARRRERPAGPTLQEAHTMHQQYLRQDTYDKRTSTYEDSK